MTQRPIMYVRTNDIEAATGKLKAWRAVEPLVLKSKRGDCIEVTLFNKLPANVPDLAWLEHAADDR
jgi:hypothetical protein